MMQFVRALNRMEWLRRRAITVRGFVDVTEEAKRFGFTETVYTSRCIWECLLKPYPFANQNDYIPLGCLLSDLKVHLLDKKEFNANASVFVRAQFPQWCRSGVNLKVTAFSPARGQGSIFVHLSEDSVPIQHRSVLLPATLLVRLADTIRHFGPVSRTNEQILVRAMRSTVEQLISSNPFRQAITAHLADAVLNPPHSLPPDDYRATLLADLDELLAIAANIANADARPKVELLRSHYRAIISPLAHFSRLLEDFLRLIQCGANPYAPFQAEVFSLLLQIHADSSTRLNRLETQVPGEALSVVRFQIRLITDAIGVPDSPFVAQIEEAFISLAKRQLPYPAHGPLNECRADVVWH